MIESGGFWDWSTLSGSAAALASDAVKTGVTRGTDLAKKKVASLWQGVKWERSEELYRTSLLGLIRCTKVLGNPKTIEIDKVYTDVFVFDKLSALRRYTETADEDEGRGAVHVEDRPRLNAAEIIGEESSTFILGRPGAGKTTFLKYLAIVACRGLSKQTPIFISLKDWSDSSESLLKYMAKQFDMCGFPDATPFLEALLSSGKALVLLDGLDEVNEWQDKRSQIIRDIVFFSNKYYKNKFCLTCRTAATDYSFERFKYVEVADFTPEQQEQFAAQWYGKKSKMYEKFLVAWRDPRSAGYRDLGRTPLLLALLCLSFDETHSFPKRQVDLYLEAINALLKKWDTSRLISRDTFYRELSYGQRQQLLETVAATFYFDSKTVFRAEEVAGAVQKFFGSLPEEGTRPVEGLEVVKQIEAQHGLLVERAKGIYSFSHLTVQEYFTASFVAKNQNANLRRQVVKSGLTDQKWREVMINTIALLPSASAMLEDMFDQLIGMKNANSGVLVFLGHCLCEVKISQAKRNLDEFLPPAVRNAAQKDMQRFEHLRRAIAKYVDGLRQPSLTPAELAKFMEHVIVLNEFLKPRMGRPQYQAAALLVAEATKFFKNEAITAGRLLGGYFIRPEQFLTFFYASRLMLECIEVAICERRDYYLSSVLTLTDIDIDKICETVGA